jgi:hypothetical protein
MHYSLQVEHSCDPQRHRACRVSVDTLNSATTGTQCAMCACVLPSLFLKSACLLVFVAQCKFVRHVTYEVTTGYYYAVGEGQEKTRLGGSLERMAFKLSRHLVSTAAS